LAPQLADIKETSFSTMEEKTPLDSIIEYKNFYEFGTAKSDPAKKSGCA